MLLRYQSQVEYYRKPLTCNSDWNILQMHFLSWTGHFAWLNYSQRCNLSKWIVLEFQITKCLYIWIHHFLTAQMLSRHQVCHMNRKVPFPFILPSCSPHMNFDFGQYFQVITLKTCPVSLSKHSNFPHLRRFRYGKKHTRGCSEVSETRTSRLKPWSQKGKVLDPILFVTEFWWFQFRLFSSVDYISSWSSHCSTEDIQSRCKHHSGGLLYLLGDWAEYAFWVSNMIIARRLPCIFLNSQMILFFLFQSRFLVAHFQHMPLVLCKYYFLVVLCSSVTSCRWDHLFRRRGRYHRVSRFCHLGADAQDHLWIQHPLPGPSWLYADHHLYHFHLLRYLVRLSV